MGGGALANGRSGGAMTGFHDQTLSLLAESGVAPVPLAAPELETWAAAEGIRWPGAALDWARRDPTGGLLGRFSNDDHFGWRRLETLPDGRRALVFHQETQGNFDAACLLDAGEDPPVLFRWFGEAWIESCPRFSDYVRAQVFDWQLKIRRDANDAVIDLFCATLALYRADGVAGLSAWCAEGPSTRWTTGGPVFVARRFRAPDGGRATVVAAEDGGEVYFGGARCTVEITAPDDAGIARFEAALLDAVGVDAAPPIFFCPHHPKDLLRALDRRIADGFVSRLRHFAKTPLGPAATARLLEIGGGFAARDTPALFPDGRTLVREIGGPEWGVRIGLVAVKDAWIAADWIAPA